MARKEKTPRTIRGVFVIFIDRLAAYPRLRHGPGFPGIEELVEVPFAALGAARFILLDHCAVVRRMLDRAEDAADSLKEPQGARILRFDEVGAALPVMLDEGRFE